MAIRRGTFRLVVPPSRALPHFLLPALALAIGFAALIMAGAFLLWLPISTESRDPPPFPAAIFTSASAATATGLSLFDTASYWSAFGEAVILVLIQAGGLGFIAAAIVVYAAATRHISLRDRENFGYSPGVSRFGNVKFLALRIVVFAFAAQLIGWLLLYADMALRGHKGHLWPTYFHAVAAFDNAAFDIYGTDRSLQTFRDDAFMLLVTAGLIIVGGLGYWIVAEAVRNPRPSKWTLDTKIVVSVSAALLFVGTLVIFLLERTNSGTLGSESLGVKALNAFFLSASARSAGMATIDFTQARPESLAFIQALMFIGTAFGSMGGGVKVATVGVLLAAIIGAAKGTDDAQIFNRRIGPDVVRRAIAVFILAGLLVTSSGMVLGTVFGAPNGEFISVQFETISAFAQVGYSAGVSRQLPVPGVLLLSFVMYAGRLGPLTLAAALVGRRRPMLYRRPYGSVRIG